MPPENQKSSSTRTVSPSTNGHDKSVPPYFFKDKNLEANKVFPTDPESAYLSSYFEDSYDFPYNPDPLASSNSYKIYDEMKHDDQVKAAISFKKDLIVSSGWQIKCEDPEISKEIENNLRQDLRISFEDSLRDILSAFEYGFSLTEILWMRDDQGHVKVKDFKTRPPHTFEFHINEKGDVEKILQNTSSKAIDFKPDYFLHHVYQPEFGNPFGQSDLRAAHQAWKAKKFFFRFWAIYVERFAAPTVIGQYPDSFDSSKVSRLQTIINTIQNSTALLVPEGTKIDFQSAEKDSSGIYENGITLLNTMIARAILMPDLMGLSGNQTNSGSRALGDTQFQLFMGLVKKEQESLSRRITAKIVRPMVQANWGDYPAEFQFKPYSKDDALEALKLWADVTKSRVWKTSEEEIKHFLEAIKFPEPTSIEVSEPLPPLPADGSSPNGKRPPDDNKPQPENDKDDDNDPPQRYSERMFREKTKYESMLNFAEIQKVLDKADDKAFTKFKSSAKVIYLDYIDQIRERNLLSKFKPELINELKIRFQKPMNQEIKVFMRDLFTESYNRAQKEIFPKVEKKFAMSEELLPDEFLEIIDAEAFKLVGDYSVNITNKMRNTTVQGIKNGVNERELLSQLKELGERETEKWLKTVIRTKSTEMFNRGRKSFWDTDEFAKQIIDAYQFSAILDDRTSDVCRFLDGKVYDKGEFISNIVPPLHFNCRSLLVPITKFEEYEADKAPTLDSLKEKGGNLIV